MHQNSQKHKESVDKYQFIQSSHANIKTLTALQKSKPEKTPMKTDQVARNRRYMIKLFKCLSFLAQKKWAQANFAEFVKFIGSACDPEILEITQDPTHYLSSTSVTELITVLSSFLEEKLLKDLREGRKFTLLADESTDVSNRTQFSIFARWIGQHGVTENFIGLINVQHTTSLALMEAIETFCHQKNLDMQNIRFVGLDGCNTMSGERKGLQRRIRHASPFSLYINCRNHRLALCFVHMMKKSPLLVEVDATLISIWKMFHFSPKKAATFKNMQEAYGQRPLAFVRASTTRWLSHLSACLRLTARFESLLDTIDALVHDSHDADILGIRNHMMRQEFVATVLVLSNMLRPVNYLSLYLQEDCGTFTELPDRVQQCLDDLESISSRYSNTTYRIWNSENVNRCLM